MSRSDFHKELQSLFLSRLENRGLVIRGFTYTKVAEVHPSIPDGVCLEPPKLPLISAYMAENDWFVIGTGQLIIAVNDEAKHIDGRDVDSVSDLGVSLDGGTRSGSMCLTVKPPFSFLQQLNGDAAEAVSDENVWLHYEVGDAAHALREALGMTCLADVEPWIKKPFCNYGPNEIRLAVRDLDRAKRFYVTKLGCRITEETETSVRIEGELLAVAFTLRLACRGEWPAVYKFPVLYTTRYLGGVRDLHEHLVEMAVNIVEPLQEEEEDSTQLQFAIADPDGNVIMFAGPP